MPLAKLFSSPSVQAVLLIKYCFLIFFFFLGISSFASDDESIQTESTSNLSSSQTDPACPQHITDSQQKALSVVDLIKSDNFIYSAVSMIDLKKITYNDFLSISVKLSEDLLYSATKNSLITINTSQQIDILTLFSKFIRENNYVLEASVIENFEKFLMYFEVEIKFTTEFRKRPLPNILVEILLQKEDIISKRMMVLSKKTVKDYQSELENITNLFRPKNNNLITPVFIFKNLIYAESQMLSILDPLEVNEYHIQSLIIVLSEAIEKYGFIPRAEVSDRIEEIALIYNNLGRSLMEFARDYTSHLEIYTKTLQTRISINNYEYTFEHYKSLRNSISTPDNTDFFKIFSSEYTSLIFRSEIGIFDFSVTPGTHIDFTMADYRAEFGKNWDLIYFFLPNLEKVKAIKGSLSLIKTDEGLYRNKFLRSILDDLFSPLNSVSSNYYIQDPDGTRRLHLYSLILDHLSFTGEQKEPLVGFFTKLGLKDPFLSMFSVYFNNDNINDFWSISFDSLKEVLSEQDIKFPWEMYSSNSESPNLFDIYQILSWLKVQHKKHPKYLHFTQEDTAYLNLIIEQRALGNTTNQTLTEIDYYQDVLRMLWQPREINALFN